MAISRDEIDKYIFDPENPKQCKSYNLLLILAKKSETKSFFSPEFLQYFFADQVINDKFDEELWDKPNNYHKLTPIQKIELFKKTNSYNDLFDIVQQIDFNIDKVIKYSFVKTLNNFNFDNSIEDDIFGEFEVNLNIKYLKNNLILLDKNYNDEEGFEKEYNENYIIFSKNYLELLNIEILKSSILVTLESNIDEFFKYINHNVKPLFLKKIEDVEILLTLLEQDLKKEKQKTLPQENIEPLNSIIIKNFFSINQITLSNLKEKKEIYIVGENGDGKTLLLQAISVALKGTEEDGLKEFRIREKEFDIEIENREDIENNFFAYGLSRNNYCQIKEDKKGYLTLFSSGYDLKKPQQWLSKLYSIELYNEKLGKKNSISVEDIKTEIITLLDRDVEIEVTPKDVTFREKGVVVSFEQLSAGYRSVITIICDLISRLSEKQQVEDISDFQGVVLIDEVELHLHPKWQYGFMQKLRTTFPLIQFIVTTHSPTVLLGAGSNDVIFYKIYKEKGETKISQPMDNIKNLMANNLSTSPLFDMETARARNSDDNLETSEDYIYTKIHQIVSEQMKGKKAIIEDEIVDIINKELDDYIKEQGL